MCARRRCSWKISLMIMTWLLFIARPFILIKEECKQLRVCVEIESKNPWESEEEEKLIFHHPNGQLCIHTPIDSRY